MKINNALYPYPVLSTSSVRDDYLPESSFSIKVDATQTGVSETSLDITVTLEDSNLNNLIATNKARIVCHVESSLSSYRKIYDINLFDMRLNIPIDPKLIRGVLELTSFIVATEDIDNFSSDMFSEFYQGKYNIQKGDILAFTPTVEIEIEPDDISKRLTQSIIKVSGHNRRDMSTDITGELIMIRLPNKTYSGYRKLSRKDSYYYELSLMAIILPALMIAIYDIKHGDGSSDNKMWSNVIKAKLKEGGMGSDPELYDPLNHAQFLLNNPADDTFKSIIISNEDSEGND